MEGEIPVVVIPVEVDYSEEEELVESAHRFGAVVFSSVLVFVTAFN